MYIEQDELWAKLPRDVKRGASRFRVRYGEAVPAEREVPRVQIRGLVIHIENQGRRFAFSVARLTLDGSLRAMLALVAKMPIVSRLNRSPALVDPSLRLPNGRMIATRHFAFPRPVQHRPAHVVVLDWIRQTF
jgi:hypothetical protein